MNGNNEKKINVKRRDVTLFFRDGSTKRFESIFTTTVAEGIVGVSLGPKDGIIKEFAYPLDLIDHFEASAYYDEVPANVHAS